MSTKQEALKKLKGHLTEDNGQWKEAARARAENKIWLQRSQKIALMILRAIRAEGINQKILAERMGVFPQQVNKWVKGKENFTLETLGKIEAALNISLIKIAAEPIVPRALPHRFKVAYPPASAAGKSSENMLKATGGTKVIKLNNGWNNTKDVG